MGLDVIGVLSHYLDGTITVTVVVKTIIDSDDGDNSLGTITKSIELLVITNVSFTNLLSSPLQLDHVLYDINKNQEGKPRGYRRRKHLCLEDFSDPLTLKMTHF